MAEALNNVPVTVQGSFGKLPDGYPAGSWPAGYLAIGDRGYLPSSMGAGNSYWLVVVDLTTLQVVVNDVYTGNDRVPASLQPYADNPLYLLIMSSMALRTDHVPQGEFYDFLNSAGAGTSLDRAEQINKQLGADAIGWVSYILAATLNTADAKGFEEFSFDGLTIMTFALMPVTVAGRAIYTPVRTGG